MRLPKWLRYWIADRACRFSDTCPGQVWAWACMDGHCIEDWFSGLLCSDAPPCPGKPNCRGASMDSPKSEFNLRLQPLADFVCNCLCRQCPQSLKLFYQGKATIEFKSPRESGEK